MPRRSGRVVRQLERFMFLGESSDLIPSKYEPDPRTYDEALQDKEAASLQKVINTKLEYMYSNRVWELIKSPNGVKAIG